MSADRNLLFGILALQLDFVSRDQLVEGMHAWVLDKTRTLGQIFVSCNAMDLDQLNLLEALVEKHVEKHGGAIEESLKQLSSIDPHATQMLNEIQDTEVHATISHVRSRDCDPYATQPLAPQPNRSSERFRIIRPHAKGGLGEVYVAQDTELPREVALKEIQSRFADDFDCRERFLREAEITGNLEHPGIVPVYGLGKYDNGRPFYAMRFVRGQSLKEAIEAFHAKYKSHLCEGEAGLELRKLLRRLVDVCNAMAYAHSRGVLHRDLKPGNIILGKYGETLVVDWGLAKARGQQEETESTLGPVTPSLDSGSTPTMLGSAIGTPAYMSPEQAAGKINELNAATDVYSLGATLFHLLTGQLPVTGESPMEMVRKAASGQIRKPRELKGDLPKALEAVCLKSMSLNKSERYATPVELADEIEKWLADEPVSAYREPLNVRTRRWARRHPSLTSGFAAAGLLSLASALCVAWLVQRHNSELTNRNGVIDQQKAELIKSNEELTATYERQIERAKEASKTLFAYGLSEYRSNRLTSCFENLFRAMELRELSDPMRKSYQQVLVDRLTHGGSSCVVMQHESEVMSLAYSPDGKTLATGSLDGIVRLWDTRTGEAIGNLMRHDSLVITLAFSIDGKKLVSGSRDKSARFWDAGTGLPIGEPMRHEDLVFRTCFSPDGKTLVTVSRGTIQLWNAQSGMPLGKPMQHASMSALTFSPDGESVVSGSFDGDLRVWDAATGVQVGEPIKFENEIRSLEFSTDGNYLAIGFRDLGAVLFDLKTRLVRGDRMQQDGEISQVTFNRDGSYLATAAASIDDSSTKRIGSVQIWDAKSGAAIGKSVQHEGDIYAIAFGSDGKRLATASSDKTARFWDVPSCNPLGQLMQHQGSVNTLVFSPDGNYLATGSSDKTVRLWDVERSSQLGTGLPKNTIIEDRRTSIPMQYLFEPASSPDGALLAVALSDNTVQMWDERAGKARGAPIRCDSRVQSLAFSPGGEKIAIGSNDVIGIFDVQTGESYGSPIRRNETVWSLAFSPTGDRLAAGSNSVQIFDVKTGSHLVETMLHGEFVIHSLAFSPDGKRLATGADDNVVRIWDAETGAEIGQSLRHDGGLMSVCFSPDGKRLAAGSQLWNVESIDTTGLNIAKDEKTGVVRLQADRKFFDQIDDQRLKQLADRQQNERFLSLRKECLFSADYLPWLCEQYPNHPTQQWRIMLAEFYAEQEKWGQASDMASLALEGPIYSSDSLQHALQLSLLCSQIHGNVESSSSLPRYCGLFLQATTEREKDALASFAVFINDMSLWELALATASSLVDLDVNSAKFHETYGATLYRTDQFENAVSELAKAIAIHTNANSNQHANQSTNASDSQSKLNGSYMTHGFLAMSYFQLKETAKSDEHRAIFDRIINESPPADVLTILQRKLLAAEIERTCAVK